MTVAEAYFNNELTKRILYFCNWEGQWYMLKGLDPAPGSGQLYFDATVINSQGGDLRLVLSRTDHLYTESEMKRHTRTASV